MKFFSWIARSYGRAKYIRVLPVVIPELESCDIQRQILFVGLVIRPNHGALEDRAKAFDGVGVGITSNLLLLMLIDDCVGEFIPDVISLPSITGGTLHYGQTVGYQIAFTGVLVREHPLKLGNGELVNGFMRFAGHDLILLYARI